MTDIVPRRAVERCERLAKLGPPPAWWRVFALRRWLRAYRAIMTLDIGEAAEMLRGVYGDQQVLAMAARPNPMLDMQRSVQATPGRRWIDPLTYEDP